MPGEPRTEDGELLDRLRRVLAPAYEIDAELGRGGMAVVYRARDVRLKRGVAVKLLPPELAFRADIRSRFLREAETAARLNHPNIVAIYTVGEDEGLVYFVMALVTGESVGERLRKTGVLPVDDARRIVREVADALAYAHDHGVVHRDIKPDNVLLDAASGRAIVTDFGIARAATEGGEDGARLTATGSVIGTPAYMSPEQCAGDREIDGRSDLYSLGTVAYQMLTGEPPFGGNSAPAIMVKQVTETPVSVRDRRPEVPEDLDRIVMRLLEKDPGARFASGQALLAALDGAPVTPPAGVPRSAARGKSRRTAPPATFVFDTQGVGGHGPMLSDRERARTLRLEARALRRRERAEGKTLPARIRSFRMQLISSVGTSAMLFGINATTGTGLWWCVIPIMGLLFGVAMNGGSLVADGVPLNQLLTNSSPRDAGPGGVVPALEAPSPAGELIPGVNPNVLASPHGTVVRQAVADRRRILEIVDRLSEAERQIVPEVKPTAEALYERIIALAAALDRLGEETGVDRVPALDERIAAIEKQAAGDRGDRERRLTLLRRQRAMLTELEESRAKLAGQIESAGLLLQNLALDLLKVRSSGLDSALGGITSATQEARALSREIGYVLSAADELRGIDGG